MTEETLIGNAKTVEVTFSSAPTTVRLDIRRPDGRLIENATVDSISATVKAHTRVLDQAGVWWFRFDSDGPDIAIEKAILVQPSKVR